MGASHLISEQRRTVNLGARSTAGLAPELIVVGVGYPGNAEREFDYAPLSQLLWKMPPERGADNFMRAMKQDVIPFIERTYRADPA
jgi:predicted alpha/beta superfamily hydrolase